MNELEPTPPSAGVTVEALALDLRVDGPDAVDLRSYLSDGYDAGDDDTVDLVDTMVRRVESWLWSRVALATPPSAGEGDEHVAWVARYPDGKREWRWAPVMDIRWIGHHLNAGATVDPLFTRPTPPPTPVQGEAAVEALRAITSQGVEGAWFADTLADAIKEALDRGAVPGYGPTDARGEAGEVVAWGVRANDSGRYIATYWQVQRAEADEHARCYLPGATVVPLVAGGTRGSGS